MLHTERQIVYPFFHFSLSQWLGKKQLILKNLPKTGFTDYHELERSEDNIPEYAQVVHECINDEMQKVARIIGYPAVLLGMWFERSAKNQRHSAHNHGACGYSAVLYVDFDPEVHDSTRFYMPFPDPMTGSITNFNPPVKEGDLIVFPSYMLHEATPNQSDKDRLVVSFNLMGKQLIYNNHSKIWDGESKKGYENIRENDRNLFDGPEY
tara:strand:+ start:126 stop:752 length:627 start_codon:yes stop_codon:yes gene_type:complete